MIDYKDFLFLMEVIRNDSLIADVSTKIKRLKYKNSQLEKSKTQKLNYIEDFGLINIHLDDLRNFLNDERIIKIDYPASNALRKTIEHLPTKEDVFNIDKEMYNNN